MDDGHAEGQILVGLELVTNAWLIAVQDEAERRVLAQCARSARDRHREAAVASHCVDCDARALIHGPDELKLLRRRFRGRCNGRTPGTDCAAASIRRSSGIPGSSWPSAHGGCGACSASTARFFSWGQPSRHLRLMTSIKIATILRPFSAGYPAAAAGSSRTAAPIAKVAASASA